MRISSIEKRTSVQSGSSFGVALVIVWKVLVEKTGWIVWFDMRRNDPGKVGRVCLVDAMTIEIQIFSDVEQIEVAVILCQVVPE